MKTLCSYLLIIFIAFSALHAQTAQQLIDRVTARYDGVHTFKAEFTQENAWPELDVEKVSRGTMYFDQSNFAIQYDEPQGQFLLVTADSMLVYDSTSLQAIVSYPQTSDAGIRPDQILSYYAGDNATTTILSNTENYAMISIEPSDGMEYKSIRVEIDLRNTLITFIYYTDLEGNTVRYTFETTLFDQPIDPSVFEWKIPIGASLIDQRL